MFIFFSLLFLFFIVLFHLWVLEMEKKHGIFPYNILANLHKRSRLPKNFTGILTYSNGERYLLWQGKYHSFFGFSAVKVPGVYEEWYRNGKLHRKNAPAVIHHNGSTFWYKNGQLHRLTGPAKELCSGIPGIVTVREWWENGKLHANGFPAIQYSDGTESYWFYGKHYTKKAYHS